MPIALVYLGKKWFSYQENWDKKIQSSGITNGEGEVCFKKTRNKGEIALGWLGWRLYAKSIGEYAWAEKALIDARGASRRVNCWQSLS